jgi:hypothetical protein
VSLVPMISASNGTTRLFMVYAPGKSVAMKYQKYTKV